MGVGVMFYLSEGTYPYITGVSGIHTTGFKLKLRPKLKLKLRLKLKVSMCLYVHVCCVMCISELSSLSLAH